MVQLRQATLTGRGDSLSPPPDLQGERRGGRGDHARQFYPIYIIFYIIIYTTRTTVHNTDRPALSLSHLSERQVGRADHARPIWAKGKAAGLITLVNSTLLSIIII